MKGVIITNGERAVTLSEMQALELLEAVRLAAQTAREGTTGNATRRLNTIGRKIGRVAAATWEDE